MKRSPNPPDQIIVPERSERVALDGAAPPGAQATPVTSVLCRAPGGAVQRQDPPAERRRAGCSNGESAVNFKVGQVMDRDFVERRDESCYLVGSRVPLACIVREFQDGQSPEAIRSAFPTLTLEHVYGAITFTWDTGPRSMRTSRLASARRMPTARRIPPPLI